MSFSYKNWIGILIVLVVILLGYSKFSASVAQTINPDCPASATNVPLYGWAWSSTIGWISFNSDNPTAPGGRHCVVIDNGTILKGWAWAANIGWIKFGGLSSIPGFTGYPSGGSTAGEATISGGQLVGWARACAGTTRAGDSTTNPKFPGDCSTMTSRADGWNGWIELTGVNHTLTYSGGNITGFAWGAENVGLVSFDVKSTPIPTPPPGSGGAPECAMSSVSTGKNPVTNRNTYDISWYPTQDAYLITQCRRVSIDPDFSTGSMSGSISGTIGVQPPEGQVSYSVSCSTTVPSVISCGSRQVTGSGPTEGTAKVTLTIDGGYEVVINNTPVPKNARVKRGEPFVLRGDVDLNYFDSGSITPDDSTGTNVNTTLINANQSVIQTKPIVTYLLAGFKDGVVTQTVIEVQAVNSSLEEI